MYKKILSIHNPTDIFPPRSPLASSVDPDDAYMFSISQAVNCHAYVSLAISMQLLSHHAVLYTIRSRCLNHLIEPELRAKTADLMLRYSLFGPNVDRLIVAMRRPEWVEQNIRSCRKGEITQEELDWLNAVKEATI